MTINVTFVQALPMTANGELNVLSAVEEIQKAKKKQANCVLFPKEWSNHLTSDNEQEFVTLMQATAVFYNIKVLFTSHVEHENQMFCIKPDGELTLQHPTEVLLFN
ncbi:hypothetical protein [Vagococcus sp.]|uniref:hypothetical protein n=1 Tax=Vagococcus sp. TaxID=1933889 RepID=UPI003F984C91